jgi:uncharacterized protein YkwD
MGKSFINAALETVTYGGYMRPYTSPNTPRLSLNIYTIIIALAFIVINPVITEAQEGKPIVLKKWFSFIKMPAFKPSAFKNVPNPSSDLKEGTVLPEQEFKMVFLVNQERMEAGLAKLEVDEVLIKLAEAKGLDMVRFNYFSHHSVRLGTVYDQLDCAKYRYQYAAENLIGAPNYWRAEDSAITSLAHRSNLLNPHFKRIGIGVVKGGSNGEMIVQILTN